MTSRLVQLSDACATCTPTGDAGCILRLCFRTRLCWCDRRGENQSLAQSSQVPPAVVVTRLALLDAARQKEVVDDTFRTSFFFFCGHERNKRTWESASVRLSLAPRLIRVRAECVPISRPPPERPVSGALRLSEVPGCSRQCLCCHVLVFCGRRKKCSAPAKTCDASVLVCLPCSCW